MPISDRKIGQLAKEYQALKAQAFELEKKIDKRKKAIITEMERRGTTGIEHEGVRVSYVTNSTTRYSIEALQQALPPQVFRAVTKPVIDTARLSAKVQQGAIEPSVVAACSEVTTSAPYIRVSLREDG